MPDRSRYGTPRSGGIGLSHISSEAAFIARAPQWERYPSRPATGAGLSQNGNQVGLDLDRRIGLVAISFRTLLQSASLRSISAKNTLMILVEANHDMSDGRLPYLDPTNHLRPQDFA